MRKKLLLFLSLFFAASVSAQMSGTYTISGDASQNPDYQTINAAATAVASQGVSGNVTFEIAPGTYEEYVVLASIDGTSEDARVTFKGMGTDNTGVVLTYNAGYSSNPTLKLGGPDFVTFENMTIQATSTNYAIVTELRGGLEGDVFKNVKFVGTVSEDFSSTSTNRNLVYVTAAGFMYTNNSFIDCEFVNGFIGLYYQGQSMEQYNEGLLVENCKFIDQLSKSMYITYTDHAVVRGCSVNSSYDKRSDYNAIDLYFSRYATIENNVFNVTRNDKYATVVKIRLSQGSEGDPIIVRNNIVNLNTSVTGNYALAVAKDQTEWVYVVHNTFNIKGEGSGSNFSIQDKATNVYAYNNIFVNETSGYVFSFNKNFTGRECDYNRVSFAGENVAYQAGTDYATLADWNTATGYDANTTTCTPNFVSATNLHLADATGSVTVSHYCDMAPADIDGETRSTTAPCAGADEFGEIPEEPVEVLTAHFEDVELNASGIWMPTEDEQDDMGYAYMRSQGWDFSNYTYYGYVFGFTASNSTDTTTTGYDASFTAVTAGGHNSEKYAVVYPGMTETMVRPADGEPRTVSGCYITNDLWTYQAILEGDGYGDNTPFGGADGTDPDYLVIIATGYDADDEEVGTAEFYLADYRFENSADDYVVTDWKWFDLSVLGEVSYIEFTMDGTKTNAYGLSTPTYFCMDDFNGEAPAEPVETLIAHFEDVELNADGIWQAETLNVDTYLYSQGWKFTAFTSESYWSNFTVSNSTNTELTGYEGQYTATTGKGVNGSDNYAVAYVYNTEVSAIDGYPREITGFYVTNNMYAYASMTEGDYYAGDPFTTDDYLVLYAIGLDEAGEETGRTEFYLADYRSAEEAEHYIVTEWQWLDLSVLGEVSKVRFEMAGSRTGEWGLNTPAYFCMDDFNGEAPVEPVETLIAHFEDVELNADGVWQAETLNVDTYFYSQGWKFSAFTSETYWSNFTVSNSTNTELTGYEGQYTATTGKGVNGSDNYAVAYVYNTEVSAIDGYPREITGFYVTNNMYAYASMTEGDYYAGDPFTTGDYLVLYAIGLDEAGDETGRTEFYLADYRSAEEAEHYIVTEWQWFDLSVLGEVSKVRFEMAGSRTGEWGLNTPAYFCMDDFNGEAPVEPVETLIAHFEDVELNADGVWQAETLNVDTYFYSQGWKFTAFTSESYWSNFTVSNSTNTELTGYEGQYTATTGKGVDGSDNYAVAYVYNTEVSAIDGYPREITGFYVTNNMYAYASMTEGDYYAGDPFTTGDYLVLYAIGLDEAGEETGRTEFYLADYHSAEEAEHYIVTEWQWFDLSVLGEVSKVRFEMAGSRTGEWGLNTPAYFCMDDFNGVAPDAVEETAAESINISVYPNPSNGVVNIKVAENEEFTYYVYNSIGQTVMTGTSANAITTIDLSTFGSGMYFLNVNCKGNVNAKKVFIK